jgi:hypothetical protein
MAGRKHHSNNALKPLMRERDRLIDQWGRLNDQAEAVSNKIQGLELAISIIQKGDGGADDADAEVAKPATNVKALLLDLAREAKAEGLNANISVKMAAKRGVALKRGTAASNLSRLKTDGALVHDGQRYKLPEFARPKSSGGFSVGGTGGTILGSTGTTVLSTSATPGNFQVVGSTMLRPKGS